MITYLIEFAILHLLFFLVFKVFLSKETQLAFLRFFLIGSTLLSLIVPTITFPSSSGIPDLTSAIVLPLVTITSDVQPSSAQIPWVMYSFLVICGVLLIRMIIGLCQILKYYFKSKKSIVEQIEVRTVSDLKNSFSFFKWIFIDPSKFEKPRDIINHEMGHVKNYHSIDILFFNMLLIIFWWVPSIWMTLKEIRKIHEFEADAFAIKKSEESYIKTLVHSTLIAHGMGLASSFNDAPIFNRLNFIKKMKRKISRWKVASIVSIMAITGVMFACEEKLESETQQILDNNSKLFDSNEVRSKLAEFEAANPEDQFIIVETNLNDPSDLAKLKEVMPGQLKWTHIQNNEGNSKMISIINIDAKGETGDGIELAKTDHEKNVFAVVENSASFRGGIDAFKTFLKENLKYPKEAFKKNIKGIVYLEFIVEKDGSLSDIKVAKGIGSGCDEEAIRVLENSPKWSPGTQRGVTVRQKLIQPISFRLDN